MSENGGLKSDRRYEKIEFLGEGQVGWIPDSKEVYN